MLKHIYDDWPHCNYLNKHFFRPWQEVLDVIYRVIFRFTYKVQWPWTLKRISKSPKLFWCNCAKWRKLRTSFPGQIFGERKLWRFWWQKKCISRSSERQMMNECSNHLPDYPQLESWISEEKVLNTFIKYRWDKSLFISAVPSVWSRSAKEEHILLSARCEEQEET